VPATTAVGRPEPLLPHPTCTHLLQHHLHHLPDGWRAATARPAPAPSPSASPAVPYELDKEAAGCEDAVEDQGGDGDVDQDEGPKERLPRRRPSNRAGVASASLPDQCRPPCNSLYTVFRIELFQRTRRCQLTGGRSVHRRFAQARHPRCAASRPAGIAWPSCGIWAEILRNGGQGGECRCPCSFWSRR
jgi:hypothetical protein